MVNGKQTRVAEARIRELHASGLTNKQMACQLGVTERAIAYRLHALGLHSNLSSTSRKVPESAFLAEYEKGLPDFAIAEQFGVSNSCIFYLRKKLGLEANRWRCARKPKETNYVPVPPVQANQNDDSMTLMACYRRKCGLTLEAMAQECGVSPGLLRIVEDGGVTSPGIARRIADRYYLTEEQYEQLIPRNYRKSGGEYAPDRYKNMENTRAFDVWRSQHDTEEKREG